MSTTVQQPPVTNPRMARRVAGASFVGTALESYDFYVFGTAAALVFNVVFFTGQDPVAGTLSAFLVFAMGFVARPLGAILFGHLGDRIGRKRTLIWTITLMGLATGTVGLLPDYNAIGIWAPIILTALRFIQGLSLGGEWGGSILIATEHAEPRKRALYASIPQLGSPVGTMLISAIFLVLAVVAPDIMTTWGWRIPFLLAFPFLAVAIYLRLAIDETPVFKQASQGHQLPRIPFVEVLKSQPVAIVVAIASAVLGIGSYFLMVTYTQAYGTETLGLSEATVLNAALIGSILQLVTIPAFGYLAMRIGSARVVAGGALGTALIAFPLYWVISIADEPMYIAAIILGGILPTASWAALGGLMADIFKPATAFTALSFAYSIAAIIAGFAPSITQQFGIATDGAWWHPGVVLAAMSLITLAGALGAVGLRSRLADPAAAGTRGA
ncbi:Inner membrane metabolite transport protein yhjE [Arthrobacter agilis]|uniref:MFS transporter n=1 Tax=Arthrobacter agilis TaxID=37921 RepID=UPI000F6D945C|nr:MFS transporter [Arthrobacter agilis]VDR33267.1 Inner membrane metabolite transport protein yhjE [Arthrobacter agilis]